MHTCALLTLFIIHTRHRGSGCIFGVEYLPFALNQFVSFTTLGLGDDADITHTCTQPLAPLSRVYMRIYIYTCTHVHVLFEIHSFHRFSP